MKIARVFPRKTAATPDDPLAFFGLPPMLALPEIDEVHVSVTFRKAHRADRLRALENAVVPQQFYPVFAAIAEIEKGENYG